MISNCLFYAISQKIKNKELKILVLPRRFTKSFFPHFFVYDKVNNIISHFAHIKKTCSLLYSGKVKTVSKEIFDEVLYRRINSYYNIKKEKVNKKLFINFETKWQKMDSFINDNKTKEFAIKNKNGYEIVVNKTPPKNCSFWRYKTIYNNSELYNDKEEYNEEYSLKESELTNL